MQNFDGLDVFALAAAMPRPLAAVMDRVVSTLQLRVAVPQWLAFLTALEDAYERVPVRSSSSADTRIAANGVARAAGMQFHNAVHAADVVQAVYCLLLAAQQLPRATDVELLAVIVAAGAHGTRGGALSLDCVCIDSNETCHPDVGHIGRTNQFLVMRGDRLALLYNDLSVRRRAVVRDYLIQDD